MPMMTLISMGLSLTSLLTLLLWVPWALTCIYRTHEERMSALMTWGHRPMSWAQLANAFQAVSFTQHFRARMLRRDPWKLYDPCVLDAIKNPRTEVMRMMMGEPPEQPPAMH